MISEKPDRFEVLCFDVGLAVLLAQRVQFALAHYLVVHQAVRAHWNRSMAHEKIKFFLSKPMGVVIDEIKKHAPFPQPLSIRIDKFKSDRNWLAHAFDAESTPWISCGQRIDEYISIMEQITRDAQAIMVDLDKIGDDLMREKGLDPQEIKRLAEENRNKGFLGLTK